MKKKNVVSLLLAELELPYSYSLLRNKNLCPERCDAVTVMRLTQRLIRIPAVAKGRDAGLTIERTLEALSPRTIQRIRAKLRRVRK